MARILAIVNPKGGVGKTTTAVNLSAMLALAGRRTLLVDLDPQGSATAGVGLARVASAHALRYLVDDAIPAEPRETEISGLDVLPAGPSLAELESLLFRREDRVTRLGKALAPQRSRFDFIVVDAPPSGGVLTQNALAACDSVVLPVQTEFCSLEGLSPLLDTVRKVKKRWNPALEIEGILLTMHEAERELARSVECEVRNFFHEKVFSIVIPRDEKLAEAASHGRPVFFTSCDARGTWAYIELAKEILR